MTPATNGSTDLTAKILLVDQESTLFELEGILQDLGPELVRAATHQEAVRHLSEDDFAVVILDLQAPGVDGFETARAIRSRERSRQTPVIFLAEGDRPEFPVVKAYALGAVDYLHKPLMPEVLRAKVAGFVKKIYVDVGDRVQEGQLLAVLEIPEMQDDITRAVAAQRRSLAELARARDELVRSQSAHEASHLSYTRLASVIKVRPNLVAQQEIDEALARDRVSEAQIASAKEALAAAEQGVQVARADEEKVKTLAAYFAHHRAFCRRHYEALRGYGRHDPGRHGLPDADHASGAAFRRPTSPPGASGARIRGAPDPRGRAGYGECAFSESRL